MRQRESGDTLIEVLIATAILAAAVVAGLGIMNFGFGIILNSIERTQVQAELTSQVSLARFARDAYIQAGRSGVGGGGAGVWESIATSAAASTSANTCNPDGTPITGTNAFYLNLDTTQGATYSNGTTTLQPSAAALWSEAVRSTTPAGVNYIDIYVKACWRPSAGSVNQEAKTILRLYAP